MAQTLVQTSSELSFTGTTSTITITPAAGNALAVFGAQVTDATAQIAPSDDRSNSYTLAHAENGTNGCGSVAVAANVVGAVTVITLGVASGSKAQSFKVQEWSGSATTQPDGSDSRNQTSTSTAHSESVAGINPSTACVVISASSCAGAITPTPGSGYTQVACARTSVFFQYQIFTSAPTSETGAWTSGSTTTQSGALLAIKAASAASRQQTLTLLGMGV